MKNENNNLMVFEGHNVEIFEWEGKVLFNSKHVAECLDIKNINDNIRNMNEKQVIKLTNSKIGKTDFRKLHNTGENFLTESGVYKLIFKSHKEEAEKFQDWVTDEVLPTIRKTGGYVNNDELFINTYLPFADDTTKSLFKGTLETVRKQNEVIAEQKKTIEHKEDVIIGLVDEIDLAQKRQVLVRVVKYKTSNYRERWNELYKQFEMKYHIDLKRRFNTYNENNKPKLKNKLDYIDKVLNKIPELYEIACKLYENDVKELVKEMYGIV